MFRRRILTTIVFLALLPNFAFPQGSSPCGALTGIKQDFNGIEQPLFSWYFIGPGPSQDCTYYYELKFTATFSGITEQWAAEVWRYSLCGGKPVLMYKDNNISSVRNWYGNMCGRDLPFFQPPPPPASTPASADPLAVTATALPPNGSAASSLLLADMNGDGIPDTIYLTATGIAVELKNSDGTLQGPAQFSTGFRPDLAYSTIVAADFNGDGKPDLAVSNAGNPPADAGSIAILLGNGDGTFQAAKSFPAGQNPSALAAADFNGDGKIDIAAGTSVVPVGGSSSIAILYGQGDGTFASPAFYPTGGDSQALPAALLALDFNGDGRSDLAVSNQGYFTTPNSSISVLLNTGAGFRAAFNAPLALPLIPDSLAYSDLNNDGKLDLVAGASQAGALLVLFGNGDGTFQTPAAYATGSSPGSVAVLPLPDHSSLVISPDQTTGNLWFASVSPTGFVAAPPFHLVGGAPTGIAVADLNGDGQPDAVVTGGSKDVSVLISKNGVLQAPVGYVLGAGALGPQALAVGDLNNDGKPDVVVASSSGAVSTLLGNGDGTLKAPLGTPVAAGAQSIALADFNRDGKLDAVVAAYNSRSASAGGIVALLGRGDGTFSAQQPVTAGSLYASSVAAGDLNGDGIPDIAAVFISGIIVGANPNTASLAVFLGKGDGTFQAARTFPLKAAASSQTGVVGNLSGVVIADWNGDGKADIAAVSQSYGTKVDILLGDGTGNFTEVPTLPATADSPVFLAAADLDHDGKMDLVVAHAGGDATYLLGNGDGTFQTEWPLNAGNSPSAVAVSKAANYSAVYSADSGGAVAVVALPVPAPAITANGSAASSTIAALAPASIATLYGGNLQSGSSGTSVTIIDSSGAQLSAPLFYVSSVQINYLVPAATALGTAQVTVANANGLKASTTSQVATIAPGIFALNSAGLVAADVLVVGPGGGQSFENVYQLDSSGNIAALPIDLSQGQVYLEIFGTGIRNAKNVTAAVGGQSVPVLSSGAQGAFDGLDQVNIGPLPQSLAGKGQTNIVVTADGQNANVVTVVFK